MFSAQVICATDLCHSLRPTQCSAGAMELCAQIWADMAAALSRLFRASTATKGEAASLAKCSLCWLRLRRKVSMPFDLIVSA